MSGSAGNTGSGKASPTGTPTSGAPAVNVPRPTGGTPVVNRPRTGSPTGGKGTGTPGVPTPVSPVTPATPAVAGPTIFDTAASQLGAAGNTFSGIARNGVDTASSDAMYGKVGAVSPIYSSINKYLNPFTDAVVNTTAGRMRDERDQSINDNQAIATGAGAFGGSRHGVVDAQIRSESQRNIGEMAKGLYSDRFTSAANLSNQDIQNMMTGQSTAAAGLASNAFNEAEAKMRAASGLSGISDTGFNRGTAAVDAQGRMGTQQQQLLQAILSGGDEDYSSYINKPQQTLGTILSAITGSPLAGNTTKSYTPGMFDYLSLGTQALSGKMRGG